VVVALALRELKDAELTRYRDPLLLGSMREDAWHIPVVDTIFEHWSFSHFYKPPLPGGFIPLLWPGPRLKGDRFYRRALRQRAAGLTIHRISSIWEAWGYALTRPSPRRA
jgi:hypothetical protein